MKLDAKWLHLKARHRNEDDKPLSHCGAAEGEEKHMMGDSTIVSSHSRAMDVLPTWRGQ